MLTREPLQQNDLVPIRHLALARVLYGVGALMISLETHATLARLVDGAVAVPVAGFLPAAGHVPVTLMTSSAVAAAAGLILGLRPRVCAAVIAALSAWALLLDQQLYSNHLLLTCLLGLLLAALPRGALRGGCADVPRWTVLLFRVQLSTMYLFAAVSKMNHDFLTGNVLDVFLRFALPLPALLPVIAGLAVLVELGVAVGLWFAELRILALVAGLLLHVGIVLVLRDPYPLIAFALVAWAGYPVVLAGARHPVRTRRSAGSPGH